MWTMLSVLSLAGCDVLSQTGALAPVAGMRQALALQFSQDRVSSALSSDSDLDLRMRCNRNHPCGGAHIEP